MSAGIGKLSSRGRSKPKSAPIKTMGGAVRAARRLGDEVLTITVDRTLGEDRRVAQIEVQASQFAAFFLRSEVEGDAHEPLAPNADLVEAIEEP